jgi:hypothetical protein
VHPKKTVAADAISKRRQLRLSCTCIAAPSKETTSVVPFGDAIVFAIASAVVASGGMLISLVGAATAEVKGTFDAALDPENAGDGVLLALWSPWSASRSSGLSTLEVHGQVKAELPSSHRTHVSMTCATPFERSTFRRTTLAELTKTDPSTTDRVNGQPCNDEMVMLTTSCENATWPPPTTWYCRTDRKVSIEVVERGARSFKSRFVRDETGHIRDDV